MTYGENRKICASTLKFHLDWYLREKESDVLARTFEDFSKDAAHVPSSASEIKKSSEFRHSFRNE